MNWEMVRYLIAGSCTTFVNIGMFSVLKYCIGLEMQIANVISIFFAIFFAFVINKRFVFCKKSKEGSGKELFRFVVMRMLSMGVEIFGMYGFTEFLFVPDLVAKVILQIVVIGMNYIISKFYIFQEDRNEKTNSDYSMF